MSLAAVLSMASCSVDKFLQPGQRVLHGNKVEIYAADGSPAPDEVQEALDNVDKYITQQPNKRILWMRLGMRLYCSTSPTDTSCWGKFWRRQGAEPVVYSQDDVVRTEAQIKLVLHNKGCFHSMVKHDTLPRGTNEVDVIYKIYATQRRQIDELRYVCQQPELQTMLEESSGESLLKVHDYYDQDFMEQERVRIATLLHNAGYYRASVENVHFLVDTTYDSRLLSIETSLRLPPDEKDSSTFKPLRQYKIGNIYIYPNITTALNEMDTRHFDTLYSTVEQSFGTTNYVYVFNRRIMPSVNSINRSMMLWNGQLYSPVNVTNTTNNLFGLNNFKYVDVSFEESPQSCDTAALLDAHIRLLNTQRHRLSFSLELTNASNYSKDQNFFTSGNFGFDAAVGYQNRNLFGGAELLNVEAKLTVDLPKNVFSGGKKSFRDIFSTFEAGLNMTLDLPNFLIPFSNKIRLHNTRPHTLIGFNIDYQYRDLTMTYDNMSQDVSLERIIWAGSFGYSWNQSRKLQHKLLPINLSYAHNISGGEYFAMLYLRTNDPQTLYQSLDYFLLNTHYEITFTNQTPGSRSNFCYLKGTVETAGNLVNAFDKMINGSQTGTIGVNDKVTYYQYFLLDAEFKQYIHWGERCTLVLRALAGAGVPYGHSFTLPYEKQFVGGGPSTMRGWSMRHLGYGQYFSSNTSSPMGVGNVRLVCNVEQRFPIISTLEGALFVDAGNVWNHTSWGLAKGSKFIPSEILRGIALDAGLGLRLGISVFLIRFDFAFPLYDPGYYAPERWIGSHFSFKLLTINFGINYPF